MTKEDYEELAAFRYALRQFQRASEQRAQDAGLTIQQYLALVAVKGYPGRDEVTVGELAERLQIHHHSAVGLVDRLVSHGLALRKPGTTDRRQVFVKLTPTGEETLEKLASRNREQLTRLRPNLRSFLDTLSHEGESESPETR
jgi:DNA-binding MarR family transcriptional regulator